MDSDDERKKAEEEKAAQRKAQASMPSKQKKKAKDPEALWNERQGNKAGGTNVDKLIQEGKKGEIISRAAEEDITNELF